jgi:hypothetical protein
MEILLILTRRIREFRMRIETILSKILADSKRDTGKVVHFLNNTSHLDSDEELKSF